MTTPNPNLTLELAELVLVHTAHLAHTQSLEDPEPVARVLNVALRNDVPNVTKRVLWDLVWITADTACRIGDVGLLKFLIDWSRGSATAARPLEMTAKAVDLASANGHTHVLDYLFDPQCRLDRELDWSTDAMDGASANGCVAVLDWWLRSGKEIKYSEKSMDSASANADFAVLNWWRKHIKTPRMSGESMRVAARDGRMDVLEWWVQFGSDRLDRDVLAGAAEGGHVHILDWFEKHGRFPLGQAPGYDYELQENTDMIASAIKARHDSILSWVVSKKKHFLSESSKEPHEGYEYSGHVSLTTLAVEHGNLAALYWLESVKRLYVRAAHVVAACKAGNHQVLDFVVRKLAGDKKSVAAYVRDQFALGWGSSEPTINFLTCYEVATKLGHVSVLDWLLKNRCERDRYRGQYMLIASRAGKVESLEWWSTRYPENVDVDLQEALVEASKRSHIQVLEWWKQEGWTQVENIHVAAVLRNSSHSSLDWWHAVLGQSTFQACSKLNFSEVAADFDQLECLIWWTSRGFPFECTQDFVDDCTRKGKLAILDWLHNWTGGSLECSQFPLENLDQRQQALVLDWWAARGCSLTSSQVTLAVHSAVPYAFFAKLERLDIPFTITSIDLDALSANGDVRGLQLALTLGAKLVYTEKALSVSSEQQMLAVLDWWLKCTLPIKLPDEEWAFWIFVHMIEEGPESVTKWWDDNLAELKLRVAAPVVNAEHE